MTTSLFGSVVHRVEDPRFLRGTARYVDDLVPEGALRAVFVRSMMPHAGLLGIDASAALALPGVAAVLTAADLELAPQPPSGEVLGPFDRPVLAEGVVRFVGEPVALVLAETPALAEDAAELVAVDLDPLEGVVDPEAALAPDAPLLFHEAGTNLAATFEEGWADDVLEGAEVVARLRVRHRRLAPVPMEPNVALVVPSEDPALTLWVSTQIPFDVRNDVAEWLGLERSDVRVVAPDVGGGFGAKLSVYPEYLALAAASRRVRRAIAWRESRSDSMVALTHGRAQVHDVELGARRDGTLVGLRVDLLGDMGAYPISAFLLPTTRTMVPGPYRIPRVATRGRSVVTNTTPIAPYRGSGRPEATLSLERAVDALAAELGMDPVEVRRRNLVEPSGFPFTTATGMVYDTGDYTAPLDAVLATVDVPALRREQQRRRHRGDRSVLGIGVATYVEITGFPSKDFAAVEIAGDGSVTVRTGISPHGQGHETSLAQLAAGMLAVPMATVRVVHSDTAEVQRGEGTWGSRSLQVAGTRVAAEAAVVIDRAREMAAATLEVDPADLEGPVDGGFRVAGAPDRALTWSELAQAAARSGEPLAASGVARDPGETFPFGAHAAVVEVDLETGMVDLLRLAAVDDCGRILNPVLVKGQQHGGMAQGVAQALFEEVRYDADGNPITATLAAYPVPSAADLPGFEAASTQTPTHVNPLGVKGIGEAGSIGSTPAVQNAVVDALAHLGVRHVDLPCTPERVWRAIRDAGGGPDRPTA
jgi:carbon-monoxide dehydrogenase large subunit